MKMKVMKGWPADAIFSSSCSSSSLLSFYLLFTFIGSFLFPNLSLSLSLSLLCLLCSFFLCHLCLFLFFSGFLVLSLCFLSSFVLCVFPPPWFSFFFFSVFAPWFSVYFLLDRLLPCVMPSSSFSVFLFFFVPIYSMFSFFLFTLPIPLSFYSFLFLSLPLRKVAFAQLL